MVLVSVTRLRLRSLRFLPAFAWHTWASSRQARRAPGFVGGYLADQGVGTFWTVTAWEEEAAMRRYRSNAAHGRVMPRLMRWCDEAAVVHWRQDSPELPDLATARARMAAEGRLSKVRHPSPAHDARRPEPSGKALRAGPWLHPIP